MSTRTRIATAVTALCLCALAARAFTLLLHPRIHTVSAAHTLLADGRHHQLAVVAARYNMPLRAEDLVAPSAPGVEFQQLTRTLVAISVRTPVNPGTLRVRVVAPGNQLVLAATLQLDTADTFADGTPDFLRLHTPEDRAAFRRWFTTLAERTADMPDAQLARDTPEITDCASLLRYSYRESLRAHDDRWYAQFPANEAAGAEPMPALPSVAQWTYPNTPLGLGLFRTEPRPFTATDLPQPTQAAPGQPAAPAAFAQFADARSLLSFNAYRISRNTSAARPGDLLFYRLLESDSQYHSMIVTGVRSEWVVYHTGPIDKHRGEMRRVLLSDLLYHPDPRWRPTPTNPNFLGVYRWNILREP